jgi:hypothetical protein
MTPRFSGSSIFTNILAILPILFLTLNQFIWKHRSRPWQHYVGFILLIIISVCLPHGHYILFSRCPTLWPKGWPYPFVSLRSSHFYWLWFHPLITTIVVSSPHTIASGCHHPSWLSHQSFFHHLLCECVMNSLLLFLTMHNDSFSLWVLPPPLFLDPTSPQLGPTFWFLPIPPPPSPSLQLT